QPDLLSIAAGELSQRTLEVGVEALGQRLGTANSLDPAQPCEQPQRLAAARLPAEAEIAGEIAEPRADRDAVATAVEAEETGAAAGRVVKVEQGADRRRLAGAVGSEKAEDLPRRDGEGDVLDAAVAAVELRQPLGLDRRSAHLLSHLRVTSGPSAIQARTSGQSRPLATL